MSEYKTQDPENSESAQSPDLQPGGRYNLVGLTAKAGSDKPYYMPADATLALDQTISPTWTASHAFQAGLNVGPNAEGTVNAQKDALRYTVASGVHAFYVGTNAVAQIDNPANPAGGSSLVSKSYVDEHSGGAGAVQPGTPKPVAVSIGNAVSAGTATTYMRSDVVLGLDQAISPNWSASHAFQAGLNVGLHSEGAVNAQSGLLKYTIGSGVHAFYVGTNAVAQIDNPASPTGGASLVSKSYVDSYVDQHVTSATVQPGDPTQPAVSIGSAVRAGTAKTYMRSDAVLGLDQGISPKWTASHAFHAGLNVGPNAEGAVNAQPGLLKYTIGSGVHAFYVGTNAIAQIDNPASPTGATSLVSKSYVDNHVGGSALQPGTPKRPAVSVGNAVSDGAAATYMRSDAVLALDQGISPKWSASHAFQAGLSVGTNSEGVVNAQPGLLKYTIGSGVHAFYVGANAVAQIDNPSSPASGTSLVSKSYVDQHVTSATVQPGTPKPVAVSIGNTVSAGTATTYLRSDAVLGLDQGISPKWSASHAFQAGLSVGPNAEGVVNAQKGVLTYTIATGGVHKFYVGTSFAQIDNPANPAGGTSLVSKSYVDQHVTSATVLPGAPKPVAVSIGNTVSAGTATTYLRSDAVLGLDQGISPQWSSPHTFLGNINFGKTNPSSLGLDGASLKYVVSSNSGVHAFYVGNTLVGVVDNPSHPSGASSLVSKTYVDQVFPATLQQYISISNIALGPNNSPATVGSSRGSLAIGRSADATSDGGIALGEAASVRTAAAGVAIGYSAMSRGTDSIALGTLSSDDGLPNVLSIGNGLGGGKLRRIIHVADGQSDTDAATVGQLKKLGTGTSPSPYLAFSTTNYGETGPAAATGNDSMAIGMQSSVTGSYNLALGKATAVDGTECAAIGYKTFCHGSQSVSLGAFSGDQGQARVVSVGSSSGGSPGVQRRIINVDDGKASNEAATLGQLQAATSARFSAYFEGSVANLPDGLPEGGGLYALNNWPVSSPGIFAAGSDTQSVARLAGHAATTSLLTFCICLNGAKIGTISFRQNQQAGTVGTITFDKNPKEQDGAWLLQVGDLVSLTAPHPAASSYELAAGLVVVLVSTVRWTCTPGG